MKPSPELARTVELEVHHVPQTLSDKTTYRIVKFMRFFADKFFAKRYGHRAVVLETVAAVPGMVGGLLQHLHAIRHIRDDQGWICRMACKCCNSPHPFSRAQTARMGSSVVPPFRRNLIVK